MQNQHQKEKRKPDVTIDADDKKRSRSDRFGFGMEGLAKDPDFKAKLAAKMQDLLKIEPCDLLLICFCPRSAPPGDRDA